MTDYKILKDLEEAKEAIAFCVQEGVFSFSLVTEKEWKDPASIIRELAFCYQHGYSYVLPLRDSGGEIRLPEEDLKEVISILARDVFNNQKVNKVAYNMKEQLHWLARLGVVQHDGEYNDPMLIQHLLDETKDLSFSSLVSYYFPGDRRLEKSGKYFDPSTSGIRRAAYLFAVYVDLLLRLYHLLEDRLLEEDKEVLDQAPSDGEDPLYQELIYAEAVPYRLYRLYRNISIPSLFVTFEAEHVGAKVDIALIQERIKRWEQALLECDTELRGLAIVKRCEAIHRREMKQRVIKKIDQKIKKAKSPHLNSKLLERIRKIKTGEEVINYKINFNDFKAIREIVYGEAGLAMPKQRPKMGQITEYPTSREVLASFDTDHPVIPLLIVHKKIKFALKKDKNLELAADEGGCVHTTFGLAGTLTGRLTSADPAMHGISGDYKIDYKSFGKGMNNGKDCFIPYSKDHVIIQADYSQAELRIIANISKDPGMRSVYEKGQDMHVITACSQLGITIEEYEALPFVDRDRYRQIAKATNFGVLYNMSIKSYASKFITDYNVEITDEDAKEKYKKFFSIYPRIKAWQEAYIKFLGGKKYVRSLFGRRRMAGGWSGRRGRRNSSAIAINSPIQATSSDLTLFAACVLRHRLPKGCYLFNTIHDSLLYYVPRGQEDLCIDIIKETCEDLPIADYFGKDPLSVKMDVCIERSDKSWGSTDVLKKERKKIESYLHSGR